MPHTLLLLTLLLPPVEGPNILFFIADDWSWLHAGTYGDAVVRTPNLDRLAREGLVFEHAYVSSPSCTPSRAAIVNWTALLAPRGGSEPLWTASGWAASIYRSP